MTDTKKKILKAAKERNIQVNLHMTVSSFLNRNFSSQETMECHSQNIKPLRKTVDQDFYNWESCPSEMNKK